MYLHLLGDLNIKPLFATRHAEYLLDDYCEAQEGNVLR